MTQLQYGLVRYLVPRGSVFCRRSGTIRSGVAAGVVVYRRRSLTGLSHLVVLDNGSSRVSCVGSLGIDE